MKKNILVTGYFNLNVGDDIFFKILFERYPHSNFYVIAPSKKALSFRHYGNVTHNESPKFSLVERVVNKFILKDYISNNYSLKYKKILDNIHTKIDGIVSIGGSLFIENTDSKIPHSSFYQDLYDILGEIPHFFLGCNFGPYVNFTFKKDYDEIFSSATDICFRDTYSANLFNDLSNVRVAPDIVFGLEHENLHCEKIRHSIGVSLMDISKRNHLANFSEDYFTKISDLLSKKIALGNFVRLFSFCNEDGDESAIKKLLSKMEDNEVNKIQIIEYNGDLDTFLKLFFEMESMVCTRFHAMILGLISNQKIYPIIYNDKMINTLNDIGYINSFSRMDDLASFTIESYLANENNPITKVEDLKESSTLHFKELDKFLKI